MTRISWRRKLRRLLHHLLWPAASVRHYPGEPAWGI